MADSLIAVRVCKNAQLVRLGNFCTRLWVTKLKSKAASLPTLLTLGFVHPSKLVFPSNFCMMQDTKHS